jgi:hypothetical protein
MTISRDPMRHDATHDLDAIYRTVGVTPVGATSAVPARFASEQRLGCTPLARQRKNLDGRGAVEAFRWCFARRYRSVPKASVT